MRHRFLLAAVLVPFTPNGQQSVAFTTVNAPARALYAHHATDSLEHQAATRVAAALCSKRIAVLGELPEHGEGRGFVIKARVIQQLVERCGFHTILFEAGSYDFFGLERSIAAAGKNAAGHADSLELALARAIGGFWWTRELADWRQWLIHETVAGRVAIGGIDDQISATAAYAKSTLPGLVRDAVPSERKAECGTVVARYLSQSYTAALPYDAAEQARLAECSRLASDRASDRASDHAGTSAERLTPDQVMLVDVASYFARERAGAALGTAGAPDRDLVMAQHVAWWLARLPRNAKVVVWTATTHATRAGGAHPVLPMGVPPLGARLTERWGDGVAVIGFSALGGQWSRAGRPSQTLAPLPADALEVRAFGDSAASDTRGWTYLDHATLRSLGAVPSRLYGKPTTADWSAAFDGVLVIRDEVAPTFEPRR